MVDKNYSIFTTTALKQGFCDPDQPANHIKGKEKGKGGRVREKRGKEGEQEGTKIEKERKNYTLNSRP